jgi:tetratricopeptide (TPR) repeat protein
MPVDYDYSLSVTADAAGILRLSGRDCYFRCWYATGTSYLHLRPGGTYEIITREHMGVWPSDHGKWLQDGRGAITLSSSEPKRSYPGVGDTSCTPMTFQGVSFLVFDTFIGFGSSNLAEIKKSIQNIEQDTQLYDVYAAIDRQVFEAERTSTQPFLFYRQIKGAQLQLATLFKGPYFAAKSLVEPYLTFSDLEIAGKTDEQKLTYLDRRLLYNPSLTDAYLARGKLHFATRRYEKALADFRKVMADEKKRDCPSCARYLHVMAGSACLQMGALPEARQCFDDLVAMAPDDARGYAGQGLVGFREGKFAAAIESFTRAIELDPKDAGYYCNRALNYAALGKIEAAHKDYAFSLERNPRDDNTWYNRGLLFHQQGKLVKATEDLTHALTLAPQRADAFCARGFILFLQRKFTQAQDDYQRALKLDPLMPAALHNRALLFMHTGRYREAVADYGAVVGRNRTDLEALVKRGVCLALLGDQAAATADFKRAIERGRLTSERAGHRKADAILANFDEMIKFNPGNSELYLMKVKALELLDKSRTSSGETK